MEYREKIHINNNLPELIKSTMCNVEVLSFLKSVNILSMEEVSRLEGSSLIQMEKAKMLYDILVTRKGAYELLCQALKKTNQTGALDILTILDEMYPDNENILYDTTKILGKGSNGTIVYEGKFGWREVAVKVQNKNFLNADATQNEIKMLSKLDSHPNVLRYFYTEVKNELVLIALERCAMNLHDEIKKKIIKMDNGVLLRKCTEGLAHLHKHRVIHRDLKPANILLTIDQEVKLSDFGLSKEIPDEQSNVIASCVVGSFDWMAPECLQDIDADSEATQLKLNTRTDIFALGCIFYYTLSNGIHPFGTRVHITSNIANGKYNLSSSHVNENWCLLITRMISQEPSKRPSAEIVLGNNVFIPITTVVKKSSNASNPSISSSNSPQEKIHLSKLTVENGDNFIKRFSEENSLVKNLARQFEKTVDIGSVDNTQHEKVFGNSKAHDDGKISTVCSVIATELKSQHCQKHVLFTRSSTLANVTTFSDRFLQILRNEGVLSDFYFNKTVKIIKQQDKQKFFRLPFAKFNYYDSIIKASRETGPTASLAILEEGYKKVETWNHRDTSLCDTDFDSLAEAIGFNCDLSLLINLFDTLADKALFFQTNIFGYTLLHVAARCGHIEIIKYLISKGLDVNAKTKANETPLHFSAAYGGSAVAVTKILLENGADLYAKSSYNNNVAYTNAFYSTPQEYYEWVKFMVQAGHNKLFYERGNQGNTPLHSVVLESEVSKATLSLFASELKFDFSITNKNGSTVLMLAALGGQGRDLLDCIINLGGNWTKKCNDSKSVLHYAVEGGNPENVEYFISLGADPNDRDRWDWTPTHYLACTFLNQIEITKVLLEHKANLFIKDKKGNNVAHSFGRTAREKADYLVWKEYLMSIGQQSLFKEIYSKGELPL